MWPNITKYPTREIAVGLLEEYLAGNLPFSLLPAEKQDEIHEEIHWMLDGATDYSFVEVLTA